MRTVFFGSPPAALPSLEALLRAGHSVELVVTQPARPAGRGLRPVPSAVGAFAAGRGLPVLESARIRTDAATAGRIRAAAADVHVVVAYGQIIPRDIHYPPRYHSLNVHFSLLPKYRGAAPVQWTVLNGDPETGVTVIELDDRMDEGDILAREPVAVRPRESAAALEGRLAAVGAGLLVRTLAAIDTVPRLPQDDAAASLAPKVRKEDGRVAWTETAAAVDRRILALADRPGVFTFFGGKRINLLRGRALEGPAAGEAAPGRIVAAGKDGLAVACGGGTVFLVETVRPAGRGAMSAHAFSLGTRLSPGDCLGS
ncbi:MAG TPA: methionyl-tRNA formyltransferase [Candidatus Aminicenantes bacterium]|nr:methionyl-tRNA formyltransferase [Candidatus Aminicenantes bacterium]